MLRSLYSAVVCASVLALVVGCSAADNTTPITGGPGGAAGTGSGADGGTGGDATGGGTGGDATGGGTGGDATGGSAGSGTETGGTGGGEPPAMCDDFWGSASDIPAANNVLTFKFLNRTNGQYPDDQVWWSFEHGGLGVDEVHTIAEQPYYDMPANGSGRMYFFLGPDGRDSDYRDFIEFTIGDNAFHGNTTEVDGVALKLAIRMHCADGYDVQVGRTCETFAENRAETWQAFKDYTPPEFDHLAEQDGDQRILNPGWGEFNEGGLYENYFAAYIDEVWAIHSLDTQSYRPDEEIPPRPDPWYLGGLGSHPALSAALHRHTAHLPYDQWEDESQFYQEAPANFYAAFWHSRSIDSRCYGFPYDDVGGYSTYISHSDPEWLMVAIGF